MEATKSIHRNIKLLLRKVEDKVSGPRGTRNRVSDG
jgi:hypothetical protein